jgi:hypothetical protein
MQNCMRHFNNITETYESLHKEYIKNPYRLSNKKAIENQMMKMVSAKQ